MSKLVKVRLLKESFLGMEDVIYPATVSAKVHGFAAIVRSSELERIGCNMLAFHGKNEWHFFIGTECEIIND